MEQQEQNSSLFQLNLDAQNSYTLRSAATWAKVLGVVGLIIGILFFIFGIVVQQQVSRYGYYNDSGFSARSIGNGGLVAYAICGLVMVITSIFALNAGNKITAGLRNNDQGALNGGFAGVRNYFAFWAVLLILMLLFLLLGILSALG